MLGLIPFKSNHSLRMGLILLKWNADSRFQAPSKRHAEVCVWHVLNKFHFLFIDLNILCMWKEQREKAFVMGRMDILLSPFHFIFLWMKSMNLPMQSQNNKMVYVGLFVRLLFVYLVFFVRGSLNLSRGREGKENNNGGMKSKVKGK